MESKSFDICSYTTNDPFNYQRHKEGCIKRKRKEEEHEQDRKRAKEDEPLVYSCNQGPLEDEPADEQESCFEGTLKIKIWIYKGTPDILTAQQKYKQKCKESAWIHLKKHKVISFYITLDTTLFKIKQIGEIETRKVYFCGKNRRMLDMGEFEEMFEQSKAKIWSNFDKWLQERSGWRIQSVNKVEDVQV